MHAADIFQSQSLTCSFEFFPPKSEKGIENLFEAVHELEALQPSFVSMTYGAGGSTRDLTHRLVTKLIKETQHNCVPHLTSISHSEAEMHDILKGYVDAGVSNILALAGDPPKDQPNYDRKQDRFRYAANLVSYIKETAKELGHPDPRGFGIGVAGFPEGHPSTPNRLEEMDFLKAKVDAGADYIVTQLFFDNHDFYDFRERCELAGIHVPIIAGIMPVQTTAGVRRMSELALGARIPARLQKAILRCDGDDDAVARVGLHWATEQCSQLINEAVQGIHFYTLNRSSATLEIFKNLGLPSSERLRRSSVA